ncbi:MAG: diguanylate cyclase, partial [Acidobacteriota bacterium]|nr:diguanylate cyclase [Acidobacteriota bacterium]
MPRQNTLIVILPIACLLAFSGFLAAQIKELGSPIITNYEPEQYKAHPQNWVAAQDQRGVMYFGNLIGILEFDGSRWRLIPTRSNSSIRALTCALDGTIYYGADGDFGYLAASPAGRVEAVSLVESIPLADREFSNIWQVLSCSKGVYFLSRTKIFRLFNGRVQTIAGRMVPSQACLLNDYIFYVDRDKGLYLLDESQIVPIPALRKVYQGKRITLAPFGPHEILAGRTSGDFLRIDLSSLWDESSQRYDISRQASPDIVMPFPSELAAALNESNASLYKLIPVDGLTFAISTLKGGIVVFDRSGKITRVINTHSGLLDNTVINIFTDHGGNLWAANNSGISHIEMSSIQSYFGPSNGISGVSMSTCMYRERLYVGTYQYLFVQTPYQFALKDDRQEFTAVKQSPNEIWQFLEVGGDLMAASAKGLFRIDGEEAVRVPGASSSAYCYSLGTSQQWPGHLFVGMLDGMEVYRQAAGEWRRIGRMEGVSDGILALTEDGNGDFWVGTTKNGLLNLRFTGGSPTRVSLRRYGPQHGLPGWAALHPYYRDSVLYVATQKGLFRSLLPAASETSPEHIRFTPDDNLGLPFLDPPTHIYSMEFDNEGRCIFSTIRGIFMAVPEKNGSYRIEARPFCGIPPTDRAIRIDAAGRLWVTGKTLYRVDLRTRKGYEQPFHALVRRVTVSSERTIFEGTHGRPAASFKDQRTLFAPEQNPEEAPSLPFRENDVFFEYAATFYEKTGGTQYQCLLEGFDDKWSGWSERTDKNYTNLPEGAYRFRVRARNAYGTIGREASFRLRIRSPWYRTGWAYLLWVIGAALALLASNRLYTLKLRRQKARLECVVAERTEQLHEATLTDPLTGLHNRRFITEVLKNDITAFIGMKKHLLQASDFRDAMPEDRIYGLFVLDIDFFKKVNDTYGHDAGDRVLKQFAGILSDSVR